MLNHFNFKQLFGEFLITNDLGMYAFLSKPDFYKFVCGKLSPNDSCYQTLCDRFFISNNSKETFLDETVDSLRALKSYMFSSTALHIFAVTNTCDLNCIYCQARDFSSKKRGFMSIKTGRKAVEVAMCSPTKYLTFEFQGGEPLLNIDVVKAMISHSKEINTEKEIQYTIVTNLVSLSDNVLEYLINENVSICTSLDGYADVHNLNRIFSNGLGSYDAVKRGIEKVKAAGRYIGAIQTTSRHSLAYPKDIVSAYVDLGISGIFLRPLTPLGTARKYWDDIGYTTDEFLSFYKEALDFIIKVNIEGLHFPEIHASYFLKKILGGYSDNYMELRSPCGASIGQLSYYHDGNVYTCDEGRLLSEMGDSSFLLGNVHTNTYDDLMNCSSCKSTSAASVIESLPGCCDCVYQPYCGVCPVVNYVDSKDIFPKSPRDYRCRIHEGILDILFKLIYMDDKAVMDVFFRWIEGC